MLEVSKLTLGFGTRILVRDLELHVEAGQRWALLGLNGSGKTTLLHALAGLARPVNGTILLEHQPIDRLNRRQIARRIGLLLQNPTDEFPLTVLETLLAGRYPHAGLWGWLGDDDPRRAEALLRRFDLEPFRDRFSDTLSGGERRRLAVAQLLMQAPRLALLDEPDSQLDPCRKTALVELLAQEFGTGNRACLMSLHDPNLARRYCTHVLMLQGEGQWDAGPVEILTRPRLERLYGCRVGEFPSDRGPVFLPGL